MLEHHAHTYTHREHKQLDVATTEIWQNECFYFSSLFYFYFLFKKK